MRNPCRSVNAAQVDQGLIDQASQHHVKAAEVGLIMISRQWRGLARPDRAEDYVKHLRNETFPALQRTAGFVDASILSRRLAAGVEFLVVTRWESLDAIVAFAGSDPEVAVVPVKAAEMMIEYDERARHFDVFK
jgi:heme-degrading monooxygenase HmoA